jgi:hypothetical protein
MGWKTHPNFFEISRANAPATSRACRQLPVRRGRRVGNVASIGLPITNLSDIVPASAGRRRIIFHHQSLITNHRSRCLSPPPLTSHESLLTSHGRDSGQAVRLQDLFLVLSQCVDLGLLSITAAFRAARDFAKILGSRIAGDTQK